MVAGVASGVFLGPASALVDRLRYRPKVQAYRVLAASLLVLMGTLATGGIVVKAVTEFIDKYNRTDANATSFLGSLYSARSGLITLMMESVGRHPMTGIGFGVPTEGGLSTAVVNDPIFNLPVMATAEKGVLPIAMLEELGYPLGILWFLYLAWLFILAAKGGPAMLGAFSAAMTVNLGESVFFSPGGMGSFVLVIVGMSVTAAPYAARIGLKKVVRTSGLIPIQFGRTLPQQAALGGR